MTRACAVPLGSAAFAFATFAMSVGLGLVNPTSVGWMLYGGDPEVHFFGWHLFRGGPWTNPAGSVPHLMWPAGTSVGLTDSIPALALRADLQLLGACVLVMSPPMLNRYYHEALSAHWMVLCALWLYLRDRTHERGAPWLALCALAAATHPYLAFMVCAVMLAAYGRVAIVYSSSRLRAIAQAVFALVVTALVWWQAGYFVVSATNLQATRFGYFTMNLLSPFLPFEAYDAMTGPFRPVTDGQYEGLAYLGAGRIMLAVTALGLSLRHVSAIAVSRAAVIGHLPLAVTLLGLTLLALGPAVTLGSWTLFEYDPAWWGPLTLFRANGRMFWPVYYAIVVLLLWLTVRWSRRYALAVMCAAVLLQAVDVTATYRVLRRMRTAGFSSPLQSRFWDAVPPHYQRIVLFPSRMCTAEATFDFRPFVLIAGRHGMAINVGAAARTEAAVIDHYCRALERDVATGSIDGDSLYVIRRDLLAPFKERTGAGTTCLTIDDHDVCVRTETVGRWRNDYAAAAE